MPILEKSDSLPESYSSRLGYGTDHTRDKYPIHVILLHHLFEQQFFLLTPNLHKNLSVILLASHLW